MITIIAKFKVKPNCTDEFNKAAIACARATRKERGNLSYRLYKGRNNPTEFTFIEEWLNDVVIEDHGKMPHFKLFIDTVTPLCEEPISIEQIMTIPN